ADAHRALRGQLAFHHSREIAADRQSEANAFVARKLLVHLHERLEDRLELFRRNPSARVDDVEANPIALRAARDRDLTAAIRELDRVRDEIDQDLARLLFVGPRGKPGLTPPAAVVNAL